MSLRERIAEEIQRGIERADGVHPVWGVDDCTLWVANILRDATGKDPAKSFRGKYSNKEEAYALIGKRGLAFGIQRRSRVFGWKPLSKKMLHLAELGDIGIFKDSQRGIQSCVLKISSRFWIGRAPLGVAYLPNEKIV